MPEKCRVQLRFSTTKHMTNGPLVKPKKAVINKVTLPKYLCFLYITGFLGILLNGMVILILSCRKQPMKGAELFILKLCLIELMQVVFAFPVIIFYCLSDLPLTTAGKSFWLSTQSKAHFCLDL